MTDRMLPSRCSLFPPSPRTQNINTPCKETSQPDMCLRVPPSLLPQGQAGTFQPSDQRVARTVGEKHRLVLFAQFCCALGWDMGLIYQCPSLCLHLTAGGFHCLNIYSLSLALPKKTHKHLQEKDSPSPGCRKRARFLVLSAKDSVFFSVRAKGAGSLGWEGVVS